MRLGNSSGFTLIELLVAVSLIGIVLVFAIPRFHHSVLSDDTRTVSRWIILKTQSLRQRAVHDQKRYALHIDIDTGRLWITGESVPEGEEQEEEEQERGAQDELQLPDGLRVLDVEYPGRELITSGQADVFFYPKGHSDRALIHIRSEDDEDLTFFVETFLSKVELYEGYMTLE